MSTTDIEPTIGELLRETQIRLKAPKRQFNKFGNYNYRNCEDILEALKEVYPEKCYVTLHDDVLFLGDRHYVQAEARFHYKDQVISACGYAHEAEEKKGMDKSQITGAASSYARKYALSGLLLIDDNKDADSRDNSRDDNQKDVSSLQFLKNLIVELKIPSTTVSEWLSKFGVRTINDIPKDKLTSIISYINRNKAKFSESHTQQGE